MAINGVGAFDPMAGIEQAQADLNSAMGAAQTDAANQNMAGLQEDITKMNKATEQIALASQMEKKLDETIMQEIKNLG